MPRPSKAVTPEWNRDMRRTCMMCPERGLCSDRLATGDFAASYSGFCPNAQSLDELGDSGDCRLVG